MSGKPLVYYFWSSTLCLFSALNWSSYNYFDLAFILRCLFECSTLKYGRGFDSALTLEWFFYSILLEGHFDFVPCAGLFRKSLFRFCTLMYSTVLI